MIDYSHLKIASPKTDTFFKHPFFTTDLGSPARHISRLPSGDLGGYSQVPKATNKFPISPTRASGNGSPGPTNASAQRYQMAAHQRIPSAEGSRHLVRNSLSFMSMLLAATHKTCIRSWLSSKANAIRGARKTTNASLFPNETHIAGPSPNNSISTTCNE